MQNNPWEIIGGWTFDEKFHSVQGELYYSFDYIMELESTHEKQLSGLK